MNPSPSNSRLYLKQIEAGPMANFIYLVGDRETRECVMIDPAWEVDRILQIAAADDMKVIAGLATHYHYDHVNGIDDLLTELQVPVYIHKADAPYLKDVQSDVKKVDSGSKLKVGEMEITFIHTPGHTPGSQCFLVNGNLVSGDTLFINACGRCDLPGGNAEELYHSLQLLGKLDEKTVLFPGHNYEDGQTTSTIGDEKRHNPYYQFKSLREFLGIRQR
ncbi:MAG: MBL fold metallo-hydrolase [Candidatus Omnitrophica bacterium]|nr:MBL fold metallo-hydrolase [Candidatus Omnitrophota bacterium]